VNDKMLYTLYSVYKRFSNVVIVINLNAENDLRNPCSFFLHYQWVAKRIHEKWNSFGSGEWKM